MSAPRAAAPPPQPADLIRSEFDRINRSLTAIQAERDQLQQLLASQEATLGQRYRDIAALTRALEESQNAAQQLRDRQAALEQQLATAQELHQQQAARIAALENSTSWRLTAPLRRLSRAINRS